MTILRPMDKPDQLRELFRMQQALNERIGVHTYDMSEEDKTKWVLNYCQYIEDCRTHMTGVDVRIRAINVLS